MPYATDTVKMTARGHIYNVQSWSTSLWFATDGFPVATTYGQDQMNGLRDSSDLRTYWDTWWHSVSAVTSSACSLSSIDYSVYEGVSHAPFAAASYVHAFTPPGVVPSLPPEVAVVVSTHTNDSGPSGRGRSYLPCMAGTMVAGTGQLDPSFVSGVLAAYTTLLSAISSHSFDDSVSGSPGQTYNLRPSLASYKKGTNHRLTSLSVDSRYDVQRRRENHLAATRQSASL